MQIKTLSFENKKLTKPSGPVIAWEKNRLA